MSEIIKLKRNEEKVNYKEIFDTPESRTVLCSSLKKLVRIEKTYADIKPFFFGYVDKFADGKELKNLKKLELTKEECESILLYHIYCAGLYPIADIFKTMQPIPEFENGECLSSWFGRVRTKMQENKIVNEGVNNDN